VTQTIWLTGLSGAGKSTIAAEVRRLLVQQRGLQSILIDGDDVRDCISADLGYTLDDRKENSRRISNISVLCAKSGVPTVVATISPLDTFRAEARELHEAQHISFVEVFVSTPIDICIERDAKNLYRQAAQGDTPMMTGISSRYEPPSKPDIVVGLPNQSPEQSAREIVDTFFPAADDSEHAQKKILKQSTLTNGG
jgi:bifunctional enzyme CysN/CysC